MAGVPAPWQGSHTWKSADTGDDSIAIRPDDPLFYPGPFYVGVYGICDSQFEICASFVRQRVQARARQGCVCGELCVLLKRTKYKC